MELIYPLLLYSAAVDFQKAYNLLETAGENFPPDALVTKDDCIIIAGLMRAVEGELVKLNCPVAAESAKKPELCMQDNKLTYGLFRKFLDEVDGRLRDEIKNTYAFSLTPREAAMFNPAQPLLGEDVLAKFESAAFDIEEAAKCLAFGRSTAAVFHALRVLETGIKALSKCLDVPHMEKPAMKSWGIVLGEIKKKIDEKWPNEKDRDSGDGQLFEDLYLLMLAIKAPRNRTMHPARKYTEAEADRFMRTIGEMMIGLAARCDEKGEPKA
jgi:HEPN domain-containing protein